MAATEDWTCPAGQISNALRKAASRDCDTGRPISGALCVDDVWVVSEQTYYRVAAGPLLAE